MRDDILNIDQKDNVKARRMLPSGEYERIERKKGEEKFDSQAWCVKNRGVWHGEEG